MWNARSCWLFAVLVFPAFLCAQSSQAGSLFDTAEISDTSTLGTVVQDDWHVDSVQGTSRQKLVEITVAEWWTGREVRMPVRLIVPLSGLATGLWLTTGHPWGSLDSDPSLSGIQGQLLNQGIGMLQTIVMPLASLPDGAALQAEMVGQFEATLDFRYRAAWIWPMTTMRAITWAHTETAYVDTTGRILVSGSSKNGMSGAAAIINDERVTGMFAQVTPAWSSPARLLESLAMSEIENATNQWSSDLAAGTLALDPVTDLAEGWYTTWSHPNDETYGFYATALGAGYSEAAVVSAWQAVAESYLVSEHWDVLQARGVDILFEPTTHDWVAFDIKEGGGANPDIPVYFEANGGHNMTAHPQAETDSANVTELLLRHLLAPPAVADIGNPALNYSLGAATLEVEVDGSGLPTGTSARIWWIYDRDPSGSAGYLWKRIPDDNWADLTYDPGTGTWSGSITLETDRETVDVFANLGMVAAGNQIYRSTPYTRISLGSAPLPIGGAVGSLLLVAALAILGRAFITGKFLSTFSRHHLER